jgi:hypothetical protein
VELGGSLRGAAVRLDQVLHQHFPPVVRVRDAVRPDDRDVHETGMTGPLGGGQQVPGAGDVAAAQAVGVAGAVHHRVDAGQDGVQAGAGVQVGLEVLAGAPAQAADVMTSFAQRLHDGTAEGAGGAGDEDASHAYPDEPDAAAVTPARMAGDG